jgi:hypothetical protein
MNTIDPEERRRQLASESQRTAQIVRVIIALALIALIFFACKSCLPTNSVDTADDYVKRYGGNRAVYQDILTTTDCAILQNKFDTAAANNDRATSGTKEFKWTLGYMTAANDRMSSIGCYK